MGAEDHRAPLEYDKLVPWPGESLLCEGMPTRYMVPLNLPNLDHLKGPLSIAFTSTG